MININLYGTSVCPAVIRWTRTGTDAPSEIQAPASLLSINLPGTLMLAVLLKLNRVPREIRFAAADELAIAITLSSVLWAASAPAQLQVVVVAIAAAPRRTSGVTRSPGNKSFAIVSEETPST
jgi:hypothetical protein